MYAGAALPNNDTLRWCLVLDSFKDIKEELRGIKGYLYNLSERMFNLREDFETNKKQQSELVELIHLSLNSTNYTELSMEEIKGNLSSIKGDVRYLNGTAESLSEMLISLLPENNTETESDELMCLKKDLDSLNGTISSLSAGIVNMSELIKNECHTCYFGTEEVPEPFPESLKCVLRGIVRKSMRTEFYKFKTSITPYLTELLMKVDNITRYLNVSVILQLEKTMLHNLTEYLQIIHDNIINSDQCIDHTILSNISEQIQIIYDYTISKKADILVPHSPTNLPPSTNHNTSPQTTNTRPPTLPPPPIPLSCQGEGEWRRVVYLDLKDPNTNCPSGWQLTSQPRRTCQSVTRSESLTCDSVTFPVSGGNYTRVCGRIIAYQYSTTRAFSAYKYAIANTTDSAYVDGISLTHGSPKQHIWSFASGASEFYHNVDVCPCDIDDEMITPPFVNDDYFCESGFNSKYADFFSNDPLWDGSGCTASSKCCSFNNPPYFTTQLPSPTSNDIEARLCHWYPNTDTPIELIELYVQ